MPSTKSDFNQPMDALESNRQTSPGNNSDNASPDSLSELLNHFVETTRGQATVTISDLLESLDSRSHGPMLLFPAIIAISPIGMIPGCP